MARFFLQFISWELWGKKDRGHVKCKVGVPNPGGETETFGLTAVEMQMMGMEVTTIICPGYLDTVYQKENLYQSTDDLADRVVNLLKSRQPSALQEKVWDLFTIVFLYEIIIAPMGKVAV